MPWQTFSTIGLFLTFVINLTCPYFRQSRRGILTTHWMINNWAMSCHWISFINSQNPFVLFLSISSLLLAADQIYHDSNEDNLMNDFNCFSFITVLLMFDVLIFSLIQIFKFEMGLITLGAMVIVFCILLLKNGRRINDNNNEEEEKSYEYLRQNSAYCFFNDFNHSFNCFGKRGYILYFGLFLNVLRQVIPSLKLHISFNYFLYILLTIGTINFIRTPVYLGGFVQSVKNIGAGAIEFIKKRKKLHSLL